MRECFVRKLTQLHLQVSYKSIELQNVLAGKLVWLQKLCLILHVATAEILQSNQCAEHLTI